LGSDKKLSEQDIQKIASQHQQMQYQAEAIMQQVNLVGNSINECQNAINSLTEIEDIEKGHEILVPIGSGTNIRASLIKPESVIIEVGAGISIEKKVDDAKKYLNTRKAELSKYQQNLEKSLNEVIKKMKEIESVVTAAVSQQKAQPMQGS
jgi:prefoldin alpha subunit